MAASEAEMQAMDATARNLAKHFNGFAGVAVVYCNSSHVTVLGGGADRGSKIRAVKAAYLAMQDLMKRMGLSVEGDSLIESSVKIELMSAGGGKDERDN